MFRVKLDIAIFVVACNVEVRNRHVFRAFNTLALRFVFEYFRKQRLFSVVGVENGGVQLALPGFTLCNVVVCYSKKIIQLPLLPLIENARRRLPVNTANEIARPACFVFQEQRCHLACKIKKVRLVECSVDDQIALDFVVHLHVVRRAFSLFDEVRENHISEHIGIQLLLVRIITDEDFHEESVDHHRVESDEGLFFLYPF